MFVNCKNNFILFLVFTLCVHWGDCVNKFSERLIANRINAQNRNLLRNDSVLLATRVATGKQVNIQSRSTVNAIGYDEKKSKVGEFNYHVSLRDIGGTHFCSGALLSNRWVLGAALCGMYQPNFLIVVGFESAVDGEIYVGDLLKIHENFNSETYEDNIALFRSSREILIHRLVQPIRYLKGTKACDVKSVITGFAGIYHMFDRQYLSDINVNLVKNEECQIILKSKGLDINLPKRVCAMGNYKWNGICNSDFSMPLASVSRVLFGINTMYQDSYYRNCDAGMPLVFTAISNYADWIEMHTNISGVDVM